jgi:hypothetical protein
MKSPVPSLFVIAALSMGSVLAAEKPGPENDYGRANIGGSQGTIKWESLLHGEGLKGWEAQEKPWTANAWSRKGDTIIADLTEGRRALLIQGNATWKSYEIKVQATLEKGSALQIHFSVSEDRKSSYHFATLTGWKAIAIIKQDHTKLDVANFIFERGREYDIVIAVRGNSITSYIDGKLINRLTLPTPPDRIEPLLIAAVPQNIRLLAHQISQG